MRNAFSWYFKASSAEVKTIWEKGLLTLDANVLLDLYRYHESTRKSLLKCIERFKGRLWLSHQAAEEFFRNRAKVITSAVGGFKLALGEIEKLSTSVSHTVSQLEANRLIASDIPAKLEQTISEAISAAQKKISASDSAYPKFLDADPLLDKLLEMFDKAVGPAFSEEESKKVKLEAEQRRKSGMPPGFLDDHKDGDRPYGDFFLWRQILNHAKTESKPVIFVTSERKEDWWERYSGRTIGPRLELVREAHEYSGQRVLIYQTDRFLELATERAGGTIDAKAVQEIRAVDDLRSSAGVVRSVTQSVKSCDSSTSFGVLLVEIARPAVLFTASGHFEPNLQAPPIIGVRLVDHPSDLLSYRLNAGSGTVHDFNVHMKSADFGVALPAGTYVFEYRAEVLQRPDAESDSPTGVM